MMQCSHSRSLGCVAVMSFSLALGFSVAAYGSDEQPRFVPTKSVFGEPQITVPIDTRDDRAILNVTINGAGPFGMLLDSSAQTVVIDKRVVRLAALTTVREIGASAWLPPGANSGDLVKVRSLSIGDAEFREFDVIAVVLGRLPGSSRRIDGLLPLSFFSGQLLTIDYPGAQVVIERGELAPPDGKTVLATSGSNGRPIVELVLAGRKLNAAIDTRNQMACTFPPDLKERVTYAYGQTAGKNSIGPQKMVDPSLAGSLRIGEHQVSYAPFELKAGPPSIGGMILRNFAVTFDQKNHRVRFSRSDRSPIKFSFLPKYGVEFELRGRHQVIVAVFPDSPVDESYLKVGHKIKTIDRRPARQYTPDALRALMDRSDSLGFTVETMGASLMLSVRAVPRSRRR